MKAEFDKRFPFVCVKFSEDFGSIEQVIFFRDFFGVPSEEGEVEEDGEPVAVYEEESGQKGMYAGFWDDVGVESVAEVDWVDVVALKVTV